ncbi:MAG: aromatic ring-hydroxylating dioxygenase subunit alpha [Nitrososphaerales archaeon]|nr:aromatic ring-hydroxylating dioxygenase subunit alpha [Nitrososphaerales archaeon]
MSSPGPKDPIVFNDWHVVGRSSDLPEGKIGKARVLGEDLVLWRFNARANVWQDLCAHRGTRLSLGRVNGDRLTCAYHGWTYDSTGQCVEFPAHPEQKPPSTAHVRNFDSQERYGLVWATLGDPSMDIPRFAEWDDPSYRKILCGPYAYRASATRAVENFLDIAHFPFVHAGLLGDEAHAEIMDYEVETADDGITARNVRVWQPDPDGTGRGKTVNYTYRVMRPFTAYFVKGTDEGQFAIQLNVTPVDETNCTGWMCIALNYAPEVPDQELLAYQDQITGQDVPVVESQRPERLPLDLQAELHLRSDRIAVAYRKWLRQLGLTFGTA